ncbi:hypothetical protein QZH41_004486 [Actinostola sp. cb2023]|nr:hypothetical protein QZH41_004486 [Actinostola sp. cb2023]
MDRQSLQKSGTKNGSTWILGPADSPWYQGAVESLVKSAKRAIHFAVNNQPLSVPEFLTLCYEVSNLMNEIPIGAQPSIDSTLNILTPNSLLLGRARAINPLGWQPHNSNIRTRYHLVQADTEDFWKRWTELYAPTLIVRRKWHTSTRNLRPGDVVIVADKNVFRGEYRLRLVKEVIPSGELEKMFQGIGHMAQGIVIHFRLAWVCRISLGKLLFAESPTSEIKKPVPSTGVR